MVLKKPLRLSRMYEMRSEVQIKCRKKFLFKLYEIVFTAYLFSRVSAVGDSSDLFLLASVVWVVRDIGRRFWNEIHNETFSCDFLYVYCSVELCRSDPFDVLQQKKSHHFRFKGFKCNSFAIVKILKITDIAIVHTKQVFENTKKNLTDYLMEISREWRRGHQI